MRKQLESAAEAAEAAAAARRPLRRPVFEVRVGDRFLRWVGAARARRMCQDRELVGRVIPSRGGGSRGGSGIGGAAAARERGAVWVEGDAPGGVFGGDLIVLARVGGPRLPITSVAGLARQLRRALMRFADQPVPEVISGHQSDGAAAEVPHLAVVPLPAVTGPFPDGALLGIALVLPRQIGDDARAAVIQALAHLEDLHQAGCGAAPRISILLGATGELVLQRGEVGAGGAELAEALWPATWIGPARRWVTATPIALDRHPGELDHGDPERRQRAHETTVAGVIEAVRRIGLPAPAEVDVLRAPALPGAADPRLYPRFPVDPRRTRRVLVHARLRFGERVRGPLLVGAGRYQGLGLLLPEDDRASVP